ncbi:MAG: tetratricopeptide repeat protein [Acidobacteria bacterium]|nr:tetratricopeptide repeat protein [Acidobacteriota bacterium]
MPLENEVTAAALAERLIEGPTFARSKRHAGLLRYLAAQPAGTEIKETRIGHEFFGRNADYDLKVDAVVRAEMRRLRERLEQYYLAEGAGDPWRLEIPKGAYEVRVVARIGAAEEEAQPASLPSSPPAWLRRRWLPVAVLLGGVLIASGMVWRLRPDPAMESIAVLPLQMSGSDAAAGDGLAREIAADLSRIRGLRVVGPEAAARALSDKVSLPEIARRLEVDGILSGAVQTGNGRMRLQLELTGAADQSVVWARTLERDVVDPFTLQNQLAASVAASIHHEMLRKPAAAAPVAAETLTLYRQGRLLLDRRTAPSIRRAVELFRSAVAKSPRYADGWAALADVLATLPDYDVPAAGWVEEARGAAGKAMAIDPENADAHAALGWIEFQSDLRAAAATRLLSRAVQLNPNHLPAQRRLGMVLLAQKRFLESEQSLRTALRLDPLSPMIRVNLAELYFYQKDFRREEPELRQALDLNPNLLVARVMLVNMLSRLGRCAEVKQFAHPLLAERDAEPWHPGLACALARCGEMGPAKAMYKTNVPEGSREMVAEFLNDWPAVYAYMDRLSREQPGFARSVSIGPDGERFAQYGPIREVFERMERKIRQPE